MDRRALYIVLGLAAAMLFAVALAGKTKPDIKSGVRPEPESAVSMKPLVPPTRSNPGRAAPPATEQAGEEPSFSRKAQPWREQAELSISERVQHDVSSIVDEALTAKTMREAAEMVRTRLDRTNSPEGRSTLYAALGTIYAREGGDAQQMNEAFEMAAKTSIHDAERVEAVFRHAKAIFDRGDAQATLRVIDEAHIDDAATSARLLQVRLVEAMAHEQLNDSEKAVQIYEAVISRAVEGKKSGRHDLENVYRQAGLRAYRIYQLNGDKAGTVRVRRLMEDDSAAS